ncbi:MAG TPA: hypothetical protein PLL11_13940, partial [Spirochaetota bacterium]|nr:hypothetical protein [Spirochaetota bacterium]
MRFFRFLAKNISYTFAIALISVFSSWVLSILAFFLGTSFIVISYDKLSTNLMKWLPIAVAIPTLIHYIMFGMLEPIGIPAFLKSLRAVNRAYRDDLE